ncbi:glycosyltransferase, partial [Streptomonospora salina]
MTIVDGGAAGGRTKPESTGRASGGAAVPRPWIRRNDYTALEIPRLGEWEPHLSVSVIVPAHGHQDKLDLVLAALAEQSYPSRLMETVVVDDGSEPPLRLPEARPENTRLIASDEGGWGSAHAVTCGAAAGDGDVVLRLDADMLVYREHVESQLRWHHAADYLAVLGHKLFVPFTPGEPDPESVRAAVAEGRAAELFDAGSAEKHWIERTIDRTEALAAADHRAHTVFIGASGSLHRDLFDEAGGLAGEMVLGGDSEFAYRLAQAGAVFVPDLDSSSWHLGRTQMQTRREAGARYRRPFVATRVPDFRDWRNQGPRQWAVPYVDVVVDVGAASLEDAETTLAPLLAGTVPDIRVRVVGTWSALSEERRSPLDEDLLDLRLIREAFRGDSRVSFAEEEPERDIAVPFRLHLPAGCAPTRRAVERITEVADQHRVGLVRLTDPSVDAFGPRPVRLERTAAFMRARRLGADQGGPEELDAAVDRLYGLHWIGGAGIVGDEDEEPPRDWGTRLRAAERKADAQRARADRLERRLR